MGDFIASNPLLPQIGEWDLTPDPQSPTLFVPHAACERTVVHMSADEKPLRNTFRFK
jgi:hypothetical protein